MPLRVAQEGPNTGLVIRGEGQLLAGAVERGIHLFFGQVGHGSI
jgi:hypothetical protein